MINPLFIQIHNHPTRMHKNQKPKLKTLPNQPTSTHQQFLFQSQSDDNPIVKKLNLASPTFATAQLGSLDADNLNLNINMNNSNGKSSKNKNINQQMQSHQMNRNNGLGNQYGDVEGNKENRVRLSLKEFVSGDVRNVDGQFLRGQNQKLVEKCKNFQSKNKHLQEQNRILKQKLKICKKCIEQKFNQVVKYLQMPNSSKQDSNIDIYLEFQAFKQDYKECHAKVQTLQTENNLLNAKIKQMEQIITNYTEKSDKKKTERAEIGDKLKQVERVYQNKLQQTKNKIKDIETQLKQKQKIIKKTKDDHEKLKFLKEEIEKKRQEDIQMREQLQIKIKEKQLNCYQLQQLLLKAQEEYQHLNIKISSYTKSTEGVQHQLLKSQEEIGRLQLSLASLEAETTRYRYNAESHKLINEKYSQELTQIRKENQIFYQNAQSLKLEKQKLEQMIAKYVFNEDKQSKKIADLESKYCQLEKQHEQIKVQFQISLMRNTTKVYPEISKFKQEENSEKEHTERIQLNSKNSEDEEKTRNLEEKYNKIVEGLNKQIEQLRKVKQNLELDLQSERERNEKINLQLQNTYRKIQQFGWSHTDFEGLRNVNKRVEYYGTGSGNTLQWTKTTKSTPQLRMIRQLLHSIISSKQAQKLSTNLTNNRLINFRQKQKDQNTLIEYLIQDIKKMTEQAADIFDTNQKQIQNLSERIQNKEQVISKLLRFTPEQKKLCILQYLRVMENIDDYPVDQVYKVTRVLEDEASQWKRYVGHVVDQLERSQEQVLSLRRQLGKIKGEGRVEGVGRKQDGWNVGSRERVEKYGGYQKYDYRRY